MTFEIVLLTSAITIAYGLLLIIGIFLIYRLTQKDRETGWNKILIGFSLIGLGGGLFVLELIFHKVYIDTIRLISLLIAALVLMTVFKESPKKGIFRK